MSYVTGDSLKVRLRIAFGARISNDPSTWPWDDVTSWWHTPDDVVHTWGRSAGADRPETAKLSFTLKNSDGRFTAYDPRSPYWPNVQKWTPVEFAVDLGDGQGWRTRFSGYIRRWPVEWPSDSPMMALAPIEAVGFLGRAGRGKPPVMSPQRRAILNARPLAYWPLEDGGDAGQAASAIAGHPAGAILGDVRFGQVAERSAGGQLALGTLPLPDLSGGGTIRVPMPATVTTATSAGAWTILLSTDCPVFDTDAGVHMIEFFTGGTYFRWLYWSSTSGNGATYLAVYTPAAVFTLALEAYASLGYQDVRISARQTNASTITISLYRSSDTATVTGTLSGTLGGLTSIGMNTRPSITTSRYAVGHLAVWNTATLPLSIALGMVDQYGKSHMSQVRGWDNEPVDVRLRRLAVEDGIDIAVPTYASPLDVTRMGRQPAVPALDLYAECEAADQGLLLEDGWGLGYIPRVARYNPPVTLTLDASQRQLGKGLAPVDDDQLLRNDWTITRTGGSSGRAVDQDSVDRQGPIPGTATVSLSRDDVLDDHARWRLRQTTVQELRYPAITFRVSGHRELAAAWTNCRQGSRIQVTNPPLQNPAGVIDQLIVGARETYSGRQKWTVSLNTVPAAPWLIGVADGEPRVCSDSSSLWDDISATATTIRVDCDLSDLWLVGNSTTSPVDFPMEAVLGGPGGERIRISAITGTTSPQTFTVVRGLDGWGRAWAFNTPVDVVVPAVVGL